MNKKSLAERLRNEARIVAFTLPYKQYLAELLIEAAVAFEQANTPPTVEQIINRFGSLSSATVNRIIAAGEEVTRVRFEDGVFE